MSSMDCSVVGYSFLKELTRVTIFGLRHQCMVLAVTSFLFHHEFTTSLPSLGCRGAAKSVFLPDACFLDSSG